jgi:hypothetical protein
LARACGSSRGDPVWVSLGIIAQGLERFHRHVAPLDAPLVVLLEEQRANIFNPCADGLGSLLVGSHNVRTWPWTDPLGQHRDGQESKVLLT